MAGRDEGAPRLKYAAKRAGHKDIEIRLNPQARHQSAGQITGCKVLRVFPNGTDHNNVPKYEFEVGNGDISFVFDEEKMDMVAYLLDDEERGTVSQVGYNRDLLASHIDIFIVVDPTIAADVEKRAEKIRRKAVEDERRRSNVEVSEDYAEETPDELDAKIKMLQEKKAKALSKATSIPSQAPVPGNKPPEVKKTKNTRKPQTPAEKKAWGADMKRRRELKRKEKAAGIAPVPKEENAVNEANCQVGAAER